MRYKRRLKKDATHWYDNSYCIKSSFIWVLKSSHITSERSNQMTRAEIDWVYSTVHVKDQVLWNVFGGTFSVSFRQNLTPHIHWTFCSQLPARSGIFCLFIGVVYWPCGLKFVYLTMNLAFLGIIVKLNLLQNFTCWLLNDFVSK